MPEQSKLIEAQGLVTKIHFFRGQEGPVIDHANFRIANSRRKSVAVQIAAVEFSSGEKRQPFATFFAYDALDDETLDTECFKVNSGQERTIRVTFPSLVFYPQVGQQMLITANFAIGNQRLVGVCELEVIEETPLLSRAATESSRQHLDRSLLELEKALENRLRHFFAPEGPPAPPEIQPTRLAPAGDDPYSRFVRDQDLDDESQLLLLLALAPWVRPDFFDRVIHSVLPEAGDYPQLGGVRGRQHRGFLPTGDTALFLLAGTDLEERVRWQALLWGDHPLVKKGVIYLQEALEGEPPMSGRLVLDSEYGERFLTGKVRAPRMSFRFPARRLETAMTWDDLVLPQRTLSQVQELEAWVRYERVLMDDWAMRKKLRPGCRALFFGPPGTGKTLTATLLGKATGREVYKVDLSMVISKYIGETEKNLAGLFDKAENKDWILFFDEADALFGKRTQVRDSHDRYANQEVSFLLQRVETFEGLVILASNLATNVDEAFARRFEQIIHFPMPRPSERRLLWRKGLPPAVSVEPGVDLGQLATRYELSGGMIMNVIRYACLQAIADGREVLRQEDLKEGIGREYAKENRLK